LFSFRMAFAGSFPQQPVADDAINRIAQRHVLELNKFSQRLLTVLGNDTGGNSAFSSASSLATRRACLTNAVNALLVGGLPRLFEGSGDSVDSVFVCIVMNRFRDFRDKSRFFYVHSCLVWYP